MAYTESTKSLVIENTEVFWGVTGGYSYCMRERCNSFYRLPFPFEKSEDYEDFIRASNLVFKLGAKSTDYLNALFSGADKYYHPSVSDLSKPFAVKRWRLYMFNQNIKNHVVQQKVYISKYTAAYPDLKLTELMSLEELPFSYWIRFLFLENPSKEVIENGMDELRNPVLFQEALRQGFDLKKTRERKISESI